MAEFRQATVAREATYSGIALHTGDRVRLTLQPAPVDSGVVFRRSDLPGKPEVRAHVRNVVDTRRATTISANGATVHTAEHLLATFHAVGVDNVVVAINGPEPPVSDGSAQAFVALVHEAGVCTQDARSRYLEMDAPVAFAANGAILVALPAAEFRVSCTVKYDQSMMDCQYLSMKVTPRTFEEALCSARTFCLFQEILPLMEADLIRGGSLDNAVVLKGQTVLSRDGLRFPDEFVRHKMLDVVGDLFLSGRRLRAHVVAVKPGHPANVAFVRQLLGEPSGTAG